MKLLIVDDNYKMREMIKNLFKPEFTEIRECEDGSEVLNEYISYRPDWVFMDIEMKILNGISASKKLLNSFPEAKIIIVTNYNNKEYRKDAKSAGVKDYILKENITDIFRIINQ